MTSPTRRALILILTAGLLPWAVGCDGGSEPSEQAPAPAADQPSGSDSGSDEQADGRSGAREIIPTPIDPPVAPGGEPLPGTPEAALDEAQENRNRASEPGAPAETPPESPADTPADDPDGGGIR